MIQALLILALALLAAVLILQLLLLKGRVRIDLASLERGQERTERGVREEVARNRDEVSRALLGVGDSVGRQMGLLSQMVEGRLRALEEDNARSLEQMRLTVDERLQGTLERRLGESFSLVSQRLDQVSRGLGEMQALASGVGDLKRVLANVKVRGIWGEVQLGRMLEEALVPDQYDRNVATAGGRERVEYAIRLPGQDGSDTIWLPIDAKFPLEDYQRLIDAQEQGLSDAAEEAGRQLEGRIKGCAQDICTKYISPPRTTDFAILYLPTEGLFAEVVRRPGLSEMVQRKHRVVIAGPSTLWALLTSLQMGFRTLAIQRRSSEVWGLLAAVKAEVGKYGDVLAKVQRKLQEASKSMDDVAVRSRAIERKLRNVEELPVGEEAGE